MPQEPGSGCTPLRTRSAGALAAALPLALLLGGCPPEAPEVARPAVSAGVTETAPDEAPAVLSEEDAMREPTPAPPPLAGRTVCIDPGHPSEVGRGCTGPHGLTELHVNWVLAQRLSRSLEGLGARVVLTKTSEPELVTNRRRAEIANAAGADLLLRIHCDARRRRGTATYYPDRQGTSGGRTGPSQEVIERSRLCAGRFHAALLQTLGPGWGDCGVLPDAATAVGARQGALTGSIFSETPVVTVEVVALTLAEDEAFAASEEGLARLTEALAAGVAAALGPAPDGTITGP